MVGYTIEGTAARLLKLRDALCKVNNYQETIEGPNMEPIPNPESKGDFAKRMVRKWLKEVYCSYEASLYEDGKKAVVDTANAEADEIGVS